MKAVASILFLLAYLAAVTTSAASSKPDEAQIQQSSQKEKSQPPITDVIDTSVDKDVIKISRNRSSHSQNVHIKTFTSVSASHHGNKALVDNVVKSVFTKKEREKQNERVEQLVEQVKKKLEQQTGALEGSATASSQEAGQGKKFAINE